MFYDSERIGNRIMSLFTLYIYNRTDTAVIMLEFATVQSLIFSPYFLHGHLSFLSVTGIKQDFFSSCLTSFIFIPDFVPVGSVSALHIHLLLLQIRGTVGVHGSVLI